MKRKLIETLNATQKSVEIYNSTDGSTVLMLPYGGRILGLFVPNSEKNFYWTNTVLENADTAKDFFNSDQWQNTGGDRTWLGPEADFFFPKFPDLSVYFQQRQLDPGNYKVVKDGNQTKLLNEFTVIPSRTGNKLDLKLTKSVGPALNPLRYERDLEHLSDIEYAGYTLYSSLEMSPESAETEVAGLWNLVQMPHGGDLIVPTYGKAEPKVYLGEIDPDDLIVKQNLLRYKMRAKGEQKIGLRAIATTGRVGYIYHSDEQWALIIRNFIVNPSGEYVDVPWKETEYLGYSTQACNVNSNLGSFSELEYHIPAIGKNTGRNYCEDSAQIWAFRGSKENIRTIASLLLAKKL